MNLGAFFNFLSTLEYFVLSHTTLKSACSATLSLIKLLDENILHSKRTILSADFYVRKNPGEVTKVTQVNDAIHKWYNNDF